jgi:phosphoserine phosphatase
MQEVYLITVSGPDKPGVTSALMNVLADHGVIILDIGQAVIHELLSLGMLVDVPAHQESASVLKELLFKAHELGLGIKFSPIPLGDYGNWVEAQGKQRHIITVLGRKLEAAHLGMVSGVIAANDLNIDVITRLSGRIPLDPDARAPYACVELSVRGTPQYPVGLRAQLLDLAHETCIDIAIQEDDIYRRNRRLVALDMDSTLIQTEVIDELGKAAGVGEQIAAITESAMRGEIEYRESLQRRLALLEGLDASVLQRIAEELPLTEGAERLIQTLRVLGYKTAVISGGFMFFGKHLQKRLGIDYVYANELELRDGKLTGKVVGDIVDREKKAELLRSLAIQENISLKQVIAVGDGANDLSMLSAAGLGIAFRAKPIVQQSAEHALSHAGLDAILYLIGVRDREALAAFPANP